MNGRAATREPVHWEAVNAAGVAARVYRPVRGGAGWLVWAHGGSWIRGSVADWHEPCSDLAKLSGCTLVSVEYRLAPTHPHPAALRDVLTVVGWAAERADRLAVGGDSAGATIAACAALTGRDQGRRLAAQLLAYPPLDPLCRAPSYRLGTAPSRADLCAAWRTYRGPDRQSVFPASYSTPWEADDLAGVAPAVLAVGALDPVADDVRDYANRLRTAGVRTTLRIFPGMAHGEFLRPGPNRLRCWLATAARDVIATRGSREETAS